MLMAVERGMVNKWKDKNLSDIDIAGIYMCCLKFLLLVF